MSSTSTEATLSTTRPFGGKKKLYNVVSVQYRLSSEKHDADARELHLRPGEEVIVETSRGPAIAQITSPIQRKVVPIDSLPRVLRKATETDIKQAKTNENIERDAYRFGIERIRTRKLPMKLIRAQFMQDGSKIVFYFSAEGRIDFRDLVKDLAHRFRARIEMHQIGVRDGARMLGGIGPCGRELCCSTFLDNFDPVSIRMAKDQGLTLNPKKVSGMCGRLMCCLVYEQQVYRRMRTRLPRAGQKVNTELGSGEIADVDVINRRVTVRFDDNNRRSLPVDEVAVIDPNAINETVDSDAEESTDYLWDDVLPEPRSRGRRRRSENQSSREASREGESSSRRPSGRRRRAPAIETTAIETTAIDRTASEETQNTGDSQASQLAGESSEATQASKNRRRRSRRSRKPANPQASSQGDNQAQRGAEKTERSEKAEKSGRSDKKSRRSGRRRTASGRKPAAGDAKKGEPKKDDSK